VKPTGFLNFVLSVVLVGLALLFTPLAGASSQPQQLFSFACQDKQLQECPQGAGPQVMIQASDGNFYGATASGGSASSGAIFKLTPGGQFTLLFSFNGINGRQPGSTLVEAPDGSLWGTTLMGGKFGLGVIFRINKDGSGFRVAQSFPDTFSTAFYFGETLTVGKDAFLYASSLGGGLFNQDLCPYGCGTLFRIDPKTGAVRILHILKPTDGLRPSGLIQASDGNFYGATTNTVFRLTPAGQFQTLVTLPYYTYIDNTYGAAVGVIQASNGNLFGVLQNRQVEPALYEVALDGSGLQVFPGVSALAFTDAVSSLLQVEDGTFWLTSYGASVGDPGSVAQLSSLDGSLLQNIPFDSNDGFGPMAPLIQGRDHNLYGTTQHGGVVSQGNPDGVVFSLSAGQDAQ